MLGDSGSGLLPAVAVQSSVRSPPTPTTSSGSSRFARKAGRLSVERLGAPKMSPFVVRATHRGARFWDESEPLSAILGASLIEFWGLPQALFRFSEGSCAIRGASRKNQAELPAACAAAALC
jgi:hypothetical protein